MKNVLRLTALAVCIACGASESKPAAFPERKTRVVDDISIEYSVGEETPLELVVAGLKRPAKTEKWRGSLPLGLAELTQRREELLGQVAGYLGLSAPTADMEEGYDKFVEIGAQVQTALATPVRRIALWRRRELVARLESGEKIHGFSLGGETGLNFRFGASVKSSREAGTEHVEEQADQVWPVVVGRSAGKSIEEEVNEGLEEWNEMTTAAVERFAPMTVFLVLHEATEIGIVRHYLPSADRRWFCDGVANYVAWRIIADIVGVENAKRYYDLQAQMIHHAHAAAEVDLARWPAAENTKKLNYGEDLNTANYAFATRVIADVCAKHGDDLLPKLFRELGKTKREKASIATVYRAYKKLTGEDLRSYLSKPKKP